MGEEMRKSKTGTQIMLTCQSVLGNKVVLTKNVYNHLVRRHPELVLFNNNSNSVEVKVSGAVYGLIPHMDECFDGIFDNAFDNSIKTNFNAPKGSWVAIDAGEPTKLTSIKLIARNHLNIVEPGDTYELMLFDKNWNSIATTVANDYFVEFGNVPAGSLLLLRNLTKGSEERIFIFENNKQVWQ